MYGKIFVNFQVKHVLFFMAAATTTKTIQHRATSIKEKPS